VSSADRREPAVKLRYLVPLIGFIVPTVGIGYGLVIPRSCIAGVARCGAVWTATQRAPIRVSHLLLTALAR
jgi:hypothetical protein